MRRKELLLQALCTVLAVLVLSPALAEAHGGIDRLSDWNGGACQLYPPETDPTAVVPAIAIGPAPNPVPPLTVSFDQP